MELGGIREPVTALDEALHARDRWSQPEAPDPVLYTVAGFDPVARTFRCRVNANFGRAQSTGSGSDTRLRAVLNVAVDLSPPRLQEQLVRPLRPGRTGRTGPRVSGEAIAARYAALVPSPYDVLLYYEDSLLLSRDQVSALRAAIRTILAARCPGPPATGNPTCARSRAAKARVPSIS